MILYFYLHGKWTCPQLEEKYFKLEPVKYAFLFEQNKTTAQVAIALYDDIQRKRDVLSAIVRRYL